MASVSKREWMHDGEARSAWVVRYKEGGKHRSRQFEKKKDADAFRRKAEAEIDAGTHVPKSQSATISELCEGYLRWQEDRWKDGRIGFGRLNQVRLALTKHVIPKLGTIVASELTASTIEVWYAALHRGGKMLPSTAKERVRELHYVFLWGKKRGAVKLNPVADVMGELRGIQKRRVRAPSREDVRALIVAAEIRPPGGRHHSLAFMKCVVHLAVFCGLRWGEIMALTIENVDVDRRVIQVRHNITHWDELKGPKTAAGVRDVYMPPHVRDFLIAWMSDFYVENDRNLLFRTRKGGKIDAASFHRGNWQPLLERAGLLREGDNLHFHALRHFAVSSAIENGLPLNDAPAFLGHKDLATTLSIYTHSTGSALQDSVGQRVAGLLLAPTPMLEISPEV